MATILIVEDERIIAGDMQRKIERLGHGVSGIASSGKDAVAAVEGRRPDLVLMDMGLRGDMDGIETARLLLKRWSVPVVFVTAHTDQATKDRAAQSQPLGYLAKPFSLEDLRVTVEKALASIPLTPTEPPATL